MYNIIVYLINMADIWQHLLSQQHYMRFIAFLSYLTIAVLVWMSVIFAQVFVHVCICVQLCTYMCALLSSDSRAVRWFVFLTTDRNFVSIRNSSYSRNVQVERYFLYFVFNVTISNKTLSFWLFRDIPLSVCATLCVCVR